MHAPTMQHEWHRRQAQRSVIALLGLLAVFSHAPAAVLTQPSAAPASAAIQRTIETPPTTARAQTRAGQPAQVRYWREVATVADGSARLRLSLHAEAKPTVPAARRFLSRFLRPPTR